MLGIQGYSGDSTVNMIQLSGNIDEWLAADPIRGAGWNSLYAKTGVRGSV